MQRSCWLTIKALAYPCGFRAIRGLGVLAVSGLADQTVRCRESANSQNTEAADYARTTRISGVLMQRSCWLTIKAFVYPCGFRAIRGLGVLAVSGPADSQRKRPAHTSRWPLDHATP
jgi:hypothetical protein